MTLATDLWVARAAPDSIQEALTQPSPGDIHALTDPVHGYLAPVIAYMTAVGMSRRPRWRAVLWIVLLLDAFSMLVTGYTTPFSIILTVLIGWTVAYGRCTRSDPRTCARPAGPDGRPQAGRIQAGERGPRGDAGHGGGPGQPWPLVLRDPGGRPPLDVTVVDREQQAQGFFYRVWRR